MQFGVYELAALIGMIAYFVIVVIIGAWSYKETKTLADYFVGGRRMGPLFGAIIYAGTVHSCASYVGVTGFAWLWGFGGTLYCYLFNLVIIGAAFILVGLAIWRVSKTFGLYTSSEFLAFRYNDPRLRPWFGVSNFVWYLFYISAQYMGIAYIIHVMIGIPIEWALLAIVGIIAFYVVLGGILAANYTTAFQGCIMFALGIVAFIILSAKMGGWAVWETIRTQAPKYWSIPGAWPWGVMLSLGFISSFIPLAMPHQWNRFMIFRDETFFKWGPLIYAIFAFQCIIGIAMVGAMGRLIVPGPLKTPDLAYPMIIRAIFPPWMAGIFMAGIIAAGMSTVDAMAAMSGQGLSRDLFNFFKPELSEKSVMRIARIATLIVMVVSLAIAWFRPAWIVFMFFLTAGGIASTFMAPMLFGLFWRRATAPAAWASSVGGVIAYVIFNLIWGFKGVNNPILKYLDPWFFGISASAILFIIVALLTKPPPEEHVNKFMNAIKGQ